jgi:hypothetical protein
MLLSDKQKEYNTFQHSLSSALVENKKLNDDLNKLDEEMARLKVKNESLQKDISNIKDNKEKYLNSYEILLKADEYYSKGFIKECSQVLINEVDYHSFNKYALNKYYSLLNNTRDKAAKLFYKDGYRSYKEGNYEESIKNLEFSLKLVDNEYFSDDCYYYIAHSQFRLNKKDLAKEAINMLLTKYDDSSYKKEVTNLLKSLDESNN